MRITPVSNHSVYSFAAKPKTSEDKKPDNTNPITQGGEKSKLALATFIGGLGLGAKLLFELMDGDFVVEDLGELAGKIVDKQHKNVSKTKKMYLGIGAFGGLLAMFVGGFALLYTLFKAPNIHYNGKVNAYQKGKDMDVYIKGNDTEKEIYTQMNEKAKSATAEEKAKLQEQYMQMQMAKNRVPDFVKNL